MKNFSLALFISIFAILPSTGFCDDQTTVEAQSGHAAGPYADVYNTFDRVRAFAADHTMPLSFELMTARCSEVPDCAGVSVGILAGNHLTRLPIVAGRILEFPLRADWVSAKARLIRFAPEDSRIFLRPVMVLRSRTVDAFSYADMEGWIEFGRGVLKRAASSGLFFLAQPPKIITFPIPAHGTLTETRDGKEYPLVINQSNEVVPYSIDISTLSKDSRFFTNFHDADISIEAPEQYFFVL